METLKLFTQNRLRLTIFLFATFILGQIILLIAGIVYGYWRIESRLVALEDKVVVADEQIRDLVDKHILAERTEREELAEKLAFYEKEFNINPLSWGKKKKKK